MTEKVFEKEKKLIKKANLTKVLPINSVKRVSEQMGISHPTVSNVSRGEKFNAEIFIKLKKELISGQENIRLALQVLEGITE